MPPIDTPELLERVAALLQAASPENADPSAEPKPSLLERPMAELNAAPRSFAEVFGPDGNLLKQLEAEARAQGDAPLAQLCAALEQGFREGHFEMAATEQPAPRLIRYVYPVV